MDNEGAEGKTAAGDMEWRQQMEARLKALEATQLDVAGETTFHENPLLATDESGAQTALGTDQALQASSATTLTEAIIMRTVAGMQGHPTNVHQVTAAMLKSHGKEAKITRFAVGSFFLVLMQTAVCFSVLTTSQWPSCVTSKDCERHRGGWCSPDKNCWDCFHIDADGSARVRFTNYTPREFCHPSNLTMQTFREQPWRVGEQFQSYQWHDGRSAEHLHHYALNICEGCYEQLDPDVWTGVSEQSYVMGNLGLMKAGDYFALLLVAGVVCMQASIERRDGKHADTICFRPCDARQFPCVVIDTDGGLVCCVVAHSSSVSVHPGPSRGRWRSMGSPCPLLLEFSQAIRVRFDTTCSRDTRRVSFTCRDNYCTQISTAVCGGDPNNRLPALQ